MLANEHQILFLKVKLYSNVRLTNFHFAPKSIFHVDWPYRRAAKMTGNLTTGKWFRRAWTKAKRSREKSLGGVPQRLMSSREKSVGWALMSVRSFPNRSDSKTDIPAVKKTLDADHSGLEKVKDRILEYLSVRKFKADGTARQPILCFVGPPGVGKTSLGRSIALAVVEGGHGRMDETLYVPMPDGDQAVRVTGPVFYDPDGERLKL